MKNMILTNIKQEDSASDEDLPDINEFETCVCLCEEVVDSKNYILQLASNLNSDTVGAALSNKQVKLYSVDENRFAYTGCGNKYKDVITDIKFSKTSYNLLWTCSKEGKVDLWDIRTPDKVNSRFQDTTDKNADKCRKFNSFDFSSNDKLLCAGTDAYAGDAFILFWDIRNTKLLGGFWLSHTNDITQVKFDENDPNKLFSGSTDGLINMYDLTQTSENDALTDTLNTESSVEKLSLFKYNNKDLIGCVTHTANFQLWEIERPNPIAHYDRSKIAQTMQRKSENHVYVVDPILRGNRLSLMVGSNLGKGECVRILNINKKNELEMLFNLKDNKQRVRSSYCGENSRLLFTGGESGILNLWNFK